MGVARSGLGWLTAKYGTLVLSFLALMFFTRELSDPTRTLGMFQVFEAALAMVMLVTSSGLGDAAIKRISERQSQERLVGALAVISVGALLVVTVAVLVLSGHISAYFGAGFLVVVSFLAALWAKQTFSMAQAVLSGVSRVGRSGGVDFVNTFVRVIAQVGLVVLGYELLGLVGGVAIGAVVAAAVGLWLLPVGVARPTRDQFASLLSFTKYSFFHGFAGRVYNNVDTLVIVWFLGSSAVSLYNVPFRITLVLDAYAGSILTSTLPEISRMEQSENEARIRELLEDALVFSTVLAIPATVGVALLARPILRTLFTSAFVGGATVATIAVAIQVPESIRSVLSSTTMGLDRPDVSLRANLLLVGINVALDLILVPTVGIEGAAIATFVGATAATAYLFRALFDLLDLGWSFFPVRSILAQLVAALSMGVVVEVLKRVLDLPVVPWLTVLVVTGVVVYWLVLLGISPAMRRRVDGIVRDLVPT